MSDALLVLNAGSSSLKFSVFVDEEPPRPLFRGQLEGLLTQPRFIAHNATAVIGEKEWRAGTNLGHQGAIEFLFTWGRGGALAGHRIIATGHRVVHGGMKFTTPVLTDTETLAEL
jgi:acetate kinase